MFDMKQGTLKFLLNASLDTLPTNANLFKWNKKTSDKCKQCKCRETTSHILNGCRVALESGKFLWRHNSIINYILQCVDTEKFTAYADLPGHTADGCGTVPPDICVTTHKPDLVIIDKKASTLNILELSVPFEQNIEARHTEKSNKYAHFVTDVTNFNTSVNCFEIGSRGFVSTRNHSNLLNIHKFVKKGIKLKTFKHNISALSVYCSYHIFICRGEPEWIAPNYLLPPFNDKSTKTT